MGISRGRQPLLPQPETDSRLGDLWLISSQSDPTLPASVAARYAAALESFSKASTAISSTSQTPNSNGSAGTGGGASSLFDAIERAIGYGIEPPEPDAGIDRPPLVTYEATPGPHGDVVRATDAYVDWFRRTYRLTGGEDRLSQPGASSQAQSLGGEAAGAVASGGRWIQNGLDP